MLTSNDYLIHHTSQIHRSFMGYLGSLRSHLLLLLNLSSLVNWNIYEQACTIFLFLFKALIVDICQHTFSFLQKNTSVDMFCRTWYNVCERFLDLIMSKCSWTFWDIRFKLSNYASFWEISLVDKSNIFIYRDRHESGIDLLI